VVDAVEEARASHSPAPGVTAAAAPFRAWRGSRMAVAGWPTRTGGDYRVTGRLAQYARRDYAIFDVGQAANPDYLW